MTLLLGFGALLNAVPAGASQADVVEELWIRSVARSLIAGEGGKHQDAASGGDWRQRVAQLEAYARAGVWGPPDLVVEEPGDRVELIAAKLRVIPWTAATAGAFESRLGRGFRSPFGALRSAALQRAALWTLEPSAMDGRASRMFERELVGGSVDIRAAKDLFRMALRSGDGRRFDSLFQLTVADEWLERADRGGWDPLLGFFEDIVAMPLSADELARLAVVSTEPGPLACLQLVARVRDGLDVVLPDATAMLPVMTASARGLDSGEVDAVAEALVEALVTGKGKALHVRDGSAVHEAVRALGDALLAESARDDLDADSRSRCLRTAARLLPVPEVLIKCAGLPDEAALEVWDTLDRRDDWPRGQELLDGLGPWLGRASVDVREAAARAVGRRYAYSGRTDLESILVAALRDADATVRSLSFAWLAKSPRPDGSEAGAMTLDAELFAAWAREGHGGESPTLTERQGRWLAQLPRDRQAVHYRGALLDLLSLEGSSQEAIGAGSVELLAGFQGDAEVFQRVAILLERSLVGMTAQVGYRARLPFDSSAARAVRILYSVDQVRAEPLVEEALLRSMDAMHGPDARGDARPQLPKTAVALLARQSSGRGRIAALQSPRLPRRVRFEIALQLLKRGLPSTGDAGEQSVGVLMGDFAGVDRALRLRAIEALGVREVLDREPIDDFLMGLTRVGSDEAERGAAIETLGRRGSLTHLASVLDAAIEGVGPDAGTIDAAANAARALRLSHGIPGKPVVAARLALARLGSPGLMRAEELELETVRGALIESLADLLVRHVADAQGGETPWLDAEEVDALLGAVMSAPLEKARVDGPRQFQSGRRIESQFLWASELAALKTLGKAPRLLRRAIGDEARWGHLDGRTLLAVARVAQEAGASDLGLELAAGAATALVGEGDAPDLRRRLAEARWLHGRLAADAGRGQLSARSYRSILGSLRRGALPRGVLRAMLSSMARPRVSLHQRYWAAVATASPASEVARRVEAWLTLL